MLYGQILHQRNWIVLVQLVKRNSDMAILLLWRRMTETRDVRGGFLEEVTEGRAIVVEVQF